MSPEPDFQVGSTGRAALREPKVKIEAARRYRFRAVHSLPEFPEPWCHPHEHNYTVELVGEFNHEHADVWMGDVVRSLMGADLNESFWPSTVENIAKDLLEDAPRDVPGIRQITVWEDDDRWGRATR